MYELTRLPNGLRVVVAPMPHVLSATVAIYVGVGSRYESAREAGSSHLLEHMLFKGTERRPSARVISETIERVGGSINASTDKESTVYWAKVAYQDLPMAMDLLGDMLLHSRLDAAEVRKEKRVVAEELGMAMDSPQDWVHTLVEETVWPDDALGRDVAGTRESVGRLSGQGLRRYLSAHYTPRATVVSIAGRVALDEAQRLVANALEGWQGGEPRAHPPARFGGPVGRIRFERRPTEQANVCIATRGVAHDDPRRFALELLNTILGGAMSSRLFVEVREERGLVYDIHSYTDRFDDTGILVVYAGMEPEAGPQVIRAVMSEFKRLREEPVTTAELERVKSQSRGRLVLGLEDTSSVANWYGGQESVLGRIESPQQVLEQVLAVSADEIQAVANDLFMDEYLRLAAIGPSGDEAELEELLHLA